MSRPLIYETQGRNPRTVAVVGTIWTLLLAAWMVLDAAGWIVGLVWLFTLPALWDMFSNRRAGMVLDRSGLRWYAGKAEAHIPLEEIDHVRLDTRLDLSVRATVYPVTGPKARLPYESTPPHLILEDALGAHGIRTERHHFTLMQ